jgi:hypothetical protein
VADARRAVLDADAHVARWREQSCARSRVRPTGRSNAATADPNRQRIWTVAQPVVDQGQQTGGRLLTLTMFASLLAGRRPWP